MAEKVHSELSPSTTERWWNCPGSVAASRGLKQTSSAYAQEGTAAHEVLERCLKNKDGLSPFDMIGMEIEGIEVTDEMAESVAFTIDFIRGEQQKGGDMFCEQEVVVIPNLISGTLDVAIIKAFDRATIIDFKYGKGVLVRAENNYQLLTYLVGIAKKYEFDIAELIIIQPRVMTEDKVSRWECDREFLETYEAELLRHIELTKEPEALLIPGEWCKFCKAKATCPSLRGELGRALAPVTNRELVFPDVKTLSTETITKILDYRERIEDWLDAVSIHAFGILEAGGLVPGYELGKKRANRRWKSDEETLKRFADLGDKLFTVKPVSPAQLEKLVGKERKSEIAELTEIPDNGYTIKKSGGKNVK